MNISDKTFPFIIGLTGGIATGKSTVSKLFADKGITIVDADLIARDMVKPHSVALAKIVEKYGKKILLDDHSLNRSALREIVFSDSSAKDWLNNLLHPLIRQEILKQLNEATSVYVILDAPLLFENGLDKLCQQTVLVDISEQLQLERACLRDGVNVKQIKNIIKSQMSSLEKKQKADHVIDNSGSVKQSQDQVDDLHKYLSERVNNKNTNT